MEDPTPARGPQQYRGLSHLRWVSASASMGARDFARQQDPGLDFRLSLLERALTRARTSGHARPLPKPGTSEAAGATEHRGANAPDHISQDRIRSERERACVVTQHEV